MAAPAEAAALASAGGGTVNQNLLMVVSGRLKEYATSVFKQVRFFIIAVVGSIRLAPADTDTSSHA